MTPVSPADTAPTIMGPYGLLAAAPDTVLWGDESVVSFSSRPTLVILRKSNSLDDVFNLTRLGKRLGTLRCCVICVLSRNLAVALLARSYLSGFTRYPRASLESPASSLVRVYFTSLYVEMSRGCFIDVPFVTEMFPSDGIFVVLISASIEPGFRSKVRECCLERRGSIDVCGRFHAGSRVMRFTSGNEAGNVHLLATLCTASTSPRWALS